MAAVAVHHIAWELEVIVVATVNVVRRVHAIQVGLMCIYAEQVRAAHFPKGAIAQLRRPRQVQHLVRRI